MTRERAELLLGIDVGTQSTKGTLARADGHVVATAERSHSVSRPHPGWVEQDAEEIWWGDAVALCHELLPQADGEVRGVAMSGLGPCVLVADENGQPLRAAILYGVDTRAWAEIEELTERYGADTILERCGSPLSSQAVGPKLLWLRRNEPEVWERTRKVFTANAYLTHRLSGEYVVDHHSASQSDPLYDLGANAWVEEWAEDIAPGLELPRLAWPNEPVGVVTAEAAEQTGLPAGIPVAPGTNDTWAEAASVGVRKPGDMMIMYATTMFMVEVLTEARPHPKLWGTASLRPGTRNLAGGMATSGALAAWVRDLTGRDADHGQLTTEAEGVPRGSDGIVCLPYFAGERSPLFDPRARGLIIGLTLSHGRGHLYRAMLEATAFGARHILEEMKSAGGNAERGIAVGGGTKAGLWPQIVSDVTGVPRQEIPRTTVGASYGDALYAAQAAGLAEQGISWNATAEVVEPDPEAHETYDELYAVYRDLYPATRDQMHALADFQLRS